MVRKPHTSHILCAVCGIRPHHVLQLSSTSPATQLHAAVVVRILLFLHLLLHHLTILTDSEGDRVLMEARVAHSRTSVLPVEFRQK